MRRNTYDIGWENGYNKALSDFKKMIPQVYQWIREQKATPSKLKIGLLIDKYMEELEDNKYSHNED